MPLYNPIGFGALDFLELAVAAVLFGLAFSRLRWLAAHKFACAGGLALLHAILRLALLPRLPVPVPAVYDEFSHLLVADTLRHLRLGNPAHPFHRFFETFFVLQTPAYSSIYPIGNGIALALFPHPWAGVLLFSGLLCVLCYWMLRAWVPPEWALTGGLLAVLIFGPLCPWTNSYWGGDVAACAGCLVFGALPRKNGLVLGLGFALHLLTRPYESIFLLLAILSYLILFPPPKLPWKAIFPAVIALGIMALQNAQVAGSWTRLPYQLSREQYGVPASLSFQAPPLPRLALTREQQLQYKMQDEFLHRPDTFFTYLSRLAYRARYYRFYFLPPLYIALAAFLISLRRLSKQALWIAAVCLLFATGTNFFPSFQPHYLAGIVCLFLVMSVKGLEYIGGDAAKAIVYLCIAQFLLTLAFTGPDAASQRRSEITRQLTGTPGKLLVFVRYWPNHIFQDEWVYNGADIDSQRVVMARDLGDEEDLRLAAYYGNRESLLLEPDARPPRLSKWQPAPKVVEAPPAPVRENHPLLQLEQVR